MKNTDVIAKKLQDALSYLYNQESNLKPFINYLQDILLNAIDKENISVKDAFEMYLAIQKQYTDSVMLITKIKEIIDFKD